MHPAREDGLKTDEGWWRSHPARALDSSRNASRLSFIDAVVFAVRAGCG